MHHDDHVIFIILSWSFGGAYELNLGLSSWSCHCRILVTKLAPALSISDHVDPRFAQVAIPEDTEIDTMIKSGQSSVVLFSFC